MARTRRNEVSRARRGVSVRGERRTVRSPVNCPVAESIAWIQQNGTHFGAPSDIMGSSLVPSSGVEVHPAVQTGCLADGSDVHQPIGMVLQPSRSDLDVLALAEFDATQRLERIDIDAANLQTVSPLESGNQSTQNIHASPFQSDGSLASVLCGGTGNPTSNALYAAPTTSVDDFPAAPQVGPEVISPLPRILPLHEAEKLHMLALELFLLEQDQSLENVSSLSPPIANQLYQPNHLEGPMQMVNYDPPGHSHISRSLLPSGEMIHHSATHPQSFAFGHWHQQSMQQMLTDLDGDMQRQLLGSAPFHSSPSNEACAMEYSAGYAPFPNSNVVTDIVPNIVEAAPTVNITPFDSLTQSPASSALPNSVLNPNGSAHSASANQIRSAPNPDASPSTMNLAEVMLSRVETQRQNHMKSERDKQRNKNELYATILNCLPLAARKIWFDNATVLLDMANHIDRSKYELKMLEQELQYSQQLVAGLCELNQYFNDMNTAASRLLTSYDLTWEDISDDPSALTAIYLHLIHFASFQRN